MIIGDIPALSRPELGQTWHQEKRSTTTVGPSQKDLRRNSRNYCPKPVMSGLPLFGLAGTLDVGLRLTVPALLLIQGAILAVPQLVVALIGGLVVRRFLGQRVIDRSSGSDV
jgi:hypothetical protein